MTDSYEKKDNVKEKAWQRAISILGKYAAPLIENENKKSREGFRALGRKIYEYSGENPKLKNYAANEASKVNNILKRFLRGETQKITDTVTFESLVGFLTDLTNEKSIKHCISKNSYKEYQYMCRKILEIYSLEGYLKEKYTESYKELYEVDLFNVDHIDKKNEDTNELIKRFHYYNKENINNNIDNKNLLFSCYRMSSTKENICITTKMLVQIPEESNDTVTFEVFSTKSSAGYRDATGKVHKLGENVYFVGKTNNDHLKILAFPKWNQDAVVVYGVLMSTEVNDKGIIAGRVVIINESLKGKNPSDCRPEKGQIEMQHMDEHLKKMHGIEEDVKDILSGISNNSYIIDGTEAEEIQKFIQEKNLTSISPFDPDRTW